MKKMLSVLLAAALSVSVLTACSSAPAETTAAQATEATTAAETTTAAPETTAAETTAAPETTAAETKAAGDDVVIRVGGLKGPTTMGLVKLIDDASKGEAENNYEFTMVTAADELTALVAGGKVDIALLPANVASVLYNKTQGNVAVIDINTLGVLYLVSGDTSITSIDQLKGQTVYLTGKGATPEYSLRYVLSAAGLTEDDVTLEFKSEATEVASVLAENPDAIGLLPQPFVTTAMMQNDKLSMIMDLTEVWDSFQPEEGGSRLVTGVTIVNKTFLEENTELINTFLTEHEASIAFADEDPATTSELIAAQGIVPKAPVALKALPYCNIEFVGGEEMKEALSGYLNALFEQNPTSVGGALPEDAFYYIP
ncbi:MAG: ABC transporter substrate-binding protein [Lachnospiraceae bacterium]|nr:ABC transporter substrate-binding protein [Lachnospiraceae bacterium]